MLALRSCAVTMFLLALCSCLVFLSVDGEDINPETYCHTCLLVAKEFNKALLAPSARRRRFEIDDLIIDVDVCNRLQSSKNFTKAQLTAACEKLFDSHYDDIYAAFVYVKKSRVDLLLCYEKSDACVGVREPEKDKGADDLRSPGAKLKKKQGLPVRKPFNQKSTLKKDEL